MTDETTRAAGDDGPMPDASKSPSMVPLSISAFQQAARDPAWRKQLADHLLHWLQTNWGPHKACPYCGSTHWAVGDIVSVLSYVGNREFPLVPVTCEKCGNTVLLSAVAMGLVRPNEPERLP